MADWYELSDHDGSFSVAGWQTIGGDWHDVEAGDDPLEAHADMIDLVSDLTVHYVSESGDDIYFTMHGPWEDWESLADIVDHSLDPYNVT